MQGDMKLFLWDNESPASDETGENKILRKDNECYNSCELSHSSLICRKQNISFGEQKRMIFSGKNQKWMVNTIFPNLMIFLFR